MSIDHWLFVIDTVLDRPAEIATLICFGFWVFSGFFAAPRGRRGTNWIAYPMAPSPLIRSTHNGWALCVLVCVLVCALVCVCVCVCVFHLLGTDRFRSLPVAPPSYRKTNKETSQFASS